jgi:hypothetical protein
VTVGFLRVALGLGLLGNLPKRLRAEPGDTAHYGDHSKGRFHGNPFFWLGKRFQYRTQSLRDTPIKRTHPHTAP